MMLVVFGHACAFWTGNWFTAITVAYQEPMISILFNWVSSFHIYAFTLVSGYIFAYKVMKGEYKVYSTFISNKVKRLLVPYWFVMLIWVLPISAYYYKWDANYLIQRYILCTNPSQLWFLWMLFVVFVIVWPLRNNMLQRPVIGYVISIVLYFVGFVGSWKIPNYFCVWTACQYVIYFYIGMRIRYKEEIKRITTTIPYYTWIIIHILLFVAKEFIDKEQNGALSFKALNSGVGLILHIIGAIMAYTTLSVIANRIHLTNVMKISLYSMPIYLFHQQIHL